MLIPSAATARRRRFQFLFGGTLIGLCIFGLNFMWGKKAGLEDLRPAEDLSVSREREVDIALGSSRASPNDEKGKSDKRDDGRSAAVPATHKGGVWLVVPAASEQVAVILASSGECHKDSQQTFGLRYTILYVLTESTAQTIASPSGRCVFLTVEAQHREQTQVAQLLTGLAKNAPGAIAFRRALASMYAIRHNATCIVECNDVCDFGVLLTDQHVMRSCSGVERCPQAGTLQTDHNTKKRRRSLVYEVVSGQQNPADETLHPAGHRKREASPFLNTYAAFGMTSIAPRGFPQGKFNWRNRVSSFEALSEERCVAGTEDRSCFGSGAWSCPRFEVAHLIPATIDIEKDRPLLQADDGYGPFPPIGGATRSFDNERATHHPFVMPGVMSIITADTAIVWPRESFWGLVLPPSLINDGDAHDAELVRGLWVQRAMWDAGGAVSHAVVSGIRPAAVLRGHQSGKTDSHVSTNPNLADVINDVLLQWKGGVDTPFRERLSVLWSHLQSATRRLGVFALSTTDESIHNSWLIDLDTFGYSFPEYISENAASLYAPSTRAAVNIHAHARLTLHDATAIVTFNFPPWTLEVIGFVAGLYERMFHRVYYVGPPHDNATTAATLRSRFGYIEYDDLASGWLLYAGIARVLNGTASSDVGYALLADDMGLHRSLFASNDEDLAKFWFQAPGGVRSIHIGPGRNISAVTSKCGKWMRLEHEQNVIGKDGQHAQLHIGVGSGVAMYYSENSLLSKELKKVLPFGILPDCAPADFMYVPAHERVSVVSLFADAFRFSIGFEFLAGILQTYYAKTREGNVRTLNSIRNWGLNRSSVEVVMGSLEAGFDTVHPVKFSQTLLRDVIVKYYVRSHIL